ncbi:MAG: hypothetical protein JRI63_14750, partial [Deltaproteobacteria bacterium]|nr:hypothetical protein [Deltaproteobacteria bacterium]
NTELPRTAGAEHVVYETIKLLEIDNLTEIREDFSFKLDKRAILGNAH